MERKKAIQLNTIDLGGGTTKGCDCEAPDLSAYAKKVDVPKKVSELENDRKFIGSDGNIIDIKGGSRNETLYKYSPRTTAIQGDEWTVIFPSFFSYSSQSVNILDRSGNVIAVAGGFRVAQLQIRFSNGVFYKSGYNPDMGDWEQEQVCGRSYGTEHYIEKPDMSEGDSESLTINTVDYSKTVEQALNKSSDDLTGLAQDVKKHETKLGKVLGRDEVVLQIGGELLGDQSFYNNSMPLLNNYSRENLLMQVAIWNYSEGLTVQLRNTNQGYNTYKVGGNFYYIGQNDSFTLYDGVFPNGEMVGYAGYGDGKDLTLIFNQDVSGSVTFRIPPTTYSTSQAVDKLYQDVEQLKETTQSGGDSQSNMQLVNEVEGSVDSTTYVYTSVSDKDNKILQFTYTVVNYTSVYSVLDANGNKIASGQTSPVVVEQHKIGPSLYKITHSKQYGNDITISTESIKYLCIGDSSGVMPTVEAEPEDEVTYSIKEYA